MLIACEYYSIDVAMTCMIDKAQERHLSEIIHSKDTTAKLKARKDLLEANLRLVLNTVKHYLGRGLEKDDLIQEGNEGLWRATETFDASQGAFSTYATNGIRMNVKRALATSARGMRVPINERSAYIALLQAWDRLFIELERDPTIAELAEATQFTEEKVQHFLRCAMSPVSGSNPVTEDDSSTAESCLLDEHADDPEEHAIKQETSARLNHAIATLLTPNERLVVTQSFGLDNQRPRTYREIAKQLKCSHQQVLILRQRALAKLAECEEVRDLAGRR